MPSKVLTPPAKTQQGYREVKFSGAIKGKRVNLCMLKGVNAAPDLSKVTSVSVVPFIDKNTMVATLLERGLDIPGGHIESSDNGIIHTVKREAYEEARIHLSDPLYLIGVISSDYRGKEPDEATYMLIMAGRVGSMDDFVAEFESVGRRVVTTEDFLMSYTAGPQAIIEEVILRARSLSGELFDISSP